MDTVDYIDVLRGAADNAGLDRDNLSVQQQTILRNMLSKRFIYAWRYGQWPDLMRIEKRYYRDVYSALTLYVLGNEVYFPQTQLCYQTLASTLGNPPADSLGVLDTTRWGLCAPRRTADNYSATRAYVAGDLLYSPSQDTFYQAIASSTGVAVTDTTKFGPFNDFSTYVSKDQNGKTAIGTVWDVWDSDRRATAQACRAEWYRSNQGIQVVSNLPWVWIEFRLREQQLTGSTYSAAATYAVNNQIFYASTNFWRCVVATVAGENPDTAPAKWSQVTIPLDFKQYLELGAASDYLAVDDDTTSDRFRMLADEKLADAAMVFLGQEGQTRRTEVLTR